MECFTGIPTVKIEIKNLIGLQNRTDFVRCVNGPLRYVSIGEVLAR
jgi:hypothetical protein